MADTLPHDEVGRAATASAEEGETEVKARVRSVVKDQPTRPDPRSERTVEHILEATFRLLTSGEGTNLTIRTVCEEADISRGTFYRYFESKEDLMDSATRYLRDQTDAGVLDIVDRTSKLSKRLQALLEFTLNNPGTGNASRLLDTEPEFLLGYFRQNFDHFIDRVSNALSPVYDEWEDNLQSGINRELVSELYVRIALSATLVPIRGDKKKMAEKLSKIADLIEAKSAYKEQG